MIFDLFLFAIKLEGFRKVHLSLTKIMMYGCYIILVYLNSTWYRLAICVFVLLIKYIDLFSLCNCYQKLNYLLFVLWCLKLSKLHVVLSSQCG